MEEPLKLNLGCGRDCRRGYVNIDRVPSEGVDLVLDLDDCRLPFSSGSVDEVLAYHVLEHILKWEDLVVEIHRVLKPGGLFDVHVPYGFLPYIGHVRFFMPWTIDGFLRGEFGGGPFLQAQPLFDKEMQKVNRRIPFRWHLRHYLHISLPDTTRIGVKWEIVWHLRKPSEVV